MTFNWKSIVALLVVCVVLSLAWGINYYRNNAIAYKEQRDKANNELKLANETIADMTIHQRAAAELDAKYTGELADAKATINQLERDVAAGRRRLQLNAKCPTNRETGSGGMGDASGPRLTDSAERDYFTLRARIVTVTKQVGYLQDYIKEQCLK